MGNHRTLPYSGLHFSKNPPKTGISSTILTIIGSLAAAVILLSLAYVAGTVTGVPIRVTEDGAPFHVTLLSVVSGSWL